MKLRVRIGGDAGDTAGSVRTLMAKVSTLVGVIAALEQAGEAARRHPGMEA